MISVTDKAGFVQLKQEIIESFRNKKEFCVSSGVWRETERGVCGGE